MRRYWIIAPYSAEQPVIFDKAWGYDLQNGTIAVGWVKIGPSIYDMKDISELRQEFIKVYGKTRPNQSRTLWNFIHEISAGDIIIARRGLKKIIGIGEVIEKAFWDYEQGIKRVGYDLESIPPGDNFVTGNFLKVKWLNTEEISFDRQVFSLTTTYEINERKYNLLITGQFQKDEKLKKGVMLMKEENKENGEILFEQPLEEEVESIEVPINQRSVYAEQGDPEVESLYNKYKRGKLIIQPDFQRHFVWDPAKSSRLIESVLLDIPLPVIYLSEEKDGKEYVIDGQQRLTAFFSFINGQFPDTRDFKLTGLKVFTNLNKKLFRELDDTYQDKVRYCKIRTITFRKESQSDLKFEIFERLNTGSVSLNDQELRNCIYRGPYNEILKELSKDKDFLYLLAIKTPDKRMKDVELVLRFASFYHATYLNYRSPMRKFLNEDMEKYQFISDNDVSEIKNAFKNTVSIIKSLLDTHAFKRFYRGDEKNPNGYWELQMFNASLYDILMYSFAKEDKNKVYQNLDTIREALIVLMTTNQDFIDSIELATSSLQAVTKRFDLWRMALQDIIGIAQKEPRCFSLELKKELYDNNPTCAICVQKIQNIDDTAIDHIKQYWKGGKTIPENARLTHRYCNWARPRTD